MTNRTDKAGLQVDSDFAAFVDRDILAGLNIAPESFWAGVADIYARFTPRNRALLARRDDIQARIDAWHQQRNGAPIDMAEYQAFLREIGYLAPEPAPFSISPTQVDAEVARLAGAQLVVPILNARFALNAANARWGSLYDALYGTDALPGAPAGKGYDAARGAQVVTAAKAFLDQAAPLAIGSHADVTGYAVKDGALIPALADPAAFAGYRGYRGDPASPSAVLLRHNGLHVEIVIDRGHPIGAGDSAGVSDVILEAALSTIVDLEDSIAAVDAQDKKAAYAVWLGLMKGDLTASFDKGGKTLSRALQPDRSLRRARRIAADASRPQPAVRAQCRPSDDDADHSAGRRLGSFRGHSRRHRHQPDRALRSAPAGRLPEQRRRLGLYRQAEDARAGRGGLRQRPVRRGRGPAGLAAPHPETRSHGRGAPHIGQPGRLYRGREASPGVHQHRLPRPHGRRDAHLDAGRRHGPQRPDENPAVDRFLRGAQRADRAGLWPVGQGPDRQGHVGRARPHGRHAGAEDRSPQVGRQHRLGAQPDGGDPARHALSPGRCVCAPEELAAQPTPGLDGLLTIPLAGGQNYSEAEVHEELDNNAQGILGYVVRWVDQGVGCSKVPDVHDVGLMEDRATLRISSQHIANWLLHGVATEAEVEAALRRMAAKVDAQNAGDPLYSPMAGNEETSLAFQAARALVFEGAEQPNGYTEPLLHAFRRRVKAGAGA